MEWWNVTLPFDINFEFISQSRHHYVQRARLHFLGTENVETKWWRKTRLNEWRIDKYFQTKWPSRQLCTIRAQPSIWCWSVSASRCLSQRNENWWRVRIMLRFQIFRWQTTATHTHTRHTPSNLNAPILIESINLRHGPAYWLQMKGKKCTEQKQSKENIMLKSIRTAWIIPYLLVKWLSQRRVANHVLYLERAVHK